jgi:hypothetical protein
LRAAVGDEVFRRAEAARCVRDEGGVGVKNNVTTTSGM